MTRTLPRPATRSPAPRRDPTAAASRARRRGRGRVLVVAAVLAVALAATGWFALVRPVVARVQIDCAPGQAHRFAVDYASRGELVDGTLGLPTAAAPASQVVDITVHGRATETCVESGPGALVFALELTEFAGEASVALGLPSAPGTRQPVRELLAGTSFVELARDGAVRSIRFADGMPVLGQNIVRDLLSHRSMKVLPTAASEWRTDEISIDGDYTAVYRVERASDTGVRLRKRRVSPAAPQGALVDRPHARYGEASQAVIAIEHAWLDQLDSTTEVEIRSGKKLVSKSRTHVVLRADAAVPRDPEPLRAQLAAMRAARVPVGDLAASEAEQRLDAKIQRDELGDDTWDTLWAKVRAAKPDEAKLFLQMRALFRIHPERCRDAAAALATIDSFKETSFMLVASALAATGTPEAQAALRDAIARLAGKHDHQDVLTAEFGNLERPDRATEAFVRDLVAHGDNDETRSVAQLALGNMAHALGASEPDRAEALVGEALQHAGAATTLDDRIVSLHTLGNTGSRRSLDALRAAARDPDFRIRQAAAAALRMLDGGDVEQLLLSLALGDPEPSVRAEAASSLRQRSLASATFDALAQLVRRDPSEAVRQTLISVIAGSAEQFPDAVDVLDWVAQHDPKQDVRRNAELALVQLRSQRG